jgi:hypothetical protein
MGWLARAFVICEGGSGAARDTIAAEVDTVGVEAGCPMLLHPAATSANVINRTTSALMAEP